MSWKITIPTRKETSPVPGGDAPVSDISPEARLLMEEKKKLANKERMKEQNPVDYNKLREEQRRQELQQALDDRELLRMPMMQF